MRKIHIIMAAVMALLVLASCNNTETYAEQKAKERAAIKQFIIDRKINVISEADFIANGYTTNISKNEYVLFDASGVYMQIVRKGCGQKIANGETVNVLCRFSETNILTDSLKLTNNSINYAATPDKMSVSNTLGTFTASFVAGRMLQVYKSSTVPTGWLVPFSYINIGRPTNEDEEVAKVNLIVPHDKGHIYASQSVYPCFFEISYERGL